MMPVRWRSALRRRHNHFAHDRHDGQGGGLRVALPVEQEGDKAAGGVRASAGSGRTVQAAGHRVDAGPPRVHAHNRRTPTVPDRRSPPQSRAPSSCRSPPSAAAQDYMPNQSAARITCSARLPRNPSLQRSNAAACRAAFAHRGAPRHASFRRRRTSLTPTIDTNPRPSNVIVPGSGTAFPLTAKSIPGVPVGSFKYQVPPVEVAPQVTTRKVMTDESATFCRALMPLRTIAA